MVFMRISPLYQSCSDRQPCLWRISSSRLIPSSDGKARMARMCNGENVHTGDKLRNSDSE